MERVWKIKKGINSFLNNDGTFGSKDPVKNATFVDFAAVKRKCFDLKLNLDFEGTDYSFRKPREEGLVYTVRIDQ